MKKKKITGSEIFISAMGLGTVKFGRKQQVKYPKSFELPSDKKIDEILHLAFENGVNLIDTAPAYGSSEERLGKALKNWRKKWIISTKVGEYFKSGEFFFDFSKKAIFQSLEKSLQSLKTDYLDIVLLHSNGEDLKILPSLDFLQEAKKKGLVRWIGISSKTKEGGIVALDNCDILMLHYNIDCQEQQEVLDLAKKKNKGVFIKKALESGNLVENSKKIKENIHFILEQPAVLSIILGTINSQHLKENITYFATF